MLGAINVEPWAAASVDGLTGTPFVARGCSVVRTGLGDYNVTLSRELDGTELVMSPAVAGNADNTITVVNTSDSVKRVLTFTAGAPADLDWQLLVWRVAP